MNVARVMDALQDLAPLSFAAEWDRVGLAIGSPSWAANTVMLTIDLTEPVLEEAIERDVDMIVAYHPPLFEALPSLTDGTPKQRIALTAARRGIAVYSPHTALDAAPGGVNDWIAEGLGQGDVRALTPHAHLPSSEQCKIVTFCPADAVDRVRAGLATVGAGQIGDYTQCSFEIVGQGTFFGGEGTSPAVGRRGSLERVDEVRLEMVCPRAALALIVLALREFHPYEEPPIEIYDLQPRPQRTVGEGRRLVLDRRTPVRELADRLKSRLGVKQVRVALGQGATKSVQIIGLCAGAGGSLLNAAIDQDCDVFITGEMRHHDVIDAQARGCSIMLAGHTNTERGYLKVLRRHLQVTEPEVAVSLSRRDTDPLKVM